MPSEWHDTVGELIEERPELAVEILRDLMHVDLPPGVPASTTSAVFNTRPSQDLVADKVVLAGTAHEVPHAIVVEAQRERLPSRLRQLPRYAMALWLRHECPVDVLVICPDKKTAEYYAEPIPIPVPYGAFLPKALFPEQVPAFTTAAEMAAHPAAMVASTHWPVHSKLGKEHYGRGLAEGRAEGERNTVLMVLRARGLKPTESEQQLVAACTDLDQLKKWAGAAVTASTTSEVFQ